jgi:hypothetical protein
MHMTKGPKDNKLKYPIYSTSLKNYFIYEIPIDIVSLFTVFYMCIIFLHIKGSK